MEQKDWDIKFLEQCLSLASQAAQKGEVPVGALVVDNANGEVIATAYNLKENLKTPLGHAEVLAIHKASRKLGKWRLSGYSLYTSLEPCVMCSGVILQARLDRVVWSAADPKGGGQTLFGLLDAQELNHSPQLSKGLFEKQSSTLLKKFFAQKRTRPKN